MAVPHGPVGQGQGVPVQGRPTAAAEVTVYVRAKIGFCNCTTGVSDDEELDRISDYDLLGNKLAALGPGRPIAVAWMKGRSRAFTVGGAATARQVGAIGRLQRPLRCHRGDRGAGARATGRDRARGAGVSQQQDRGALGRGHARALAKRNAQLRGALNLKIV